MQLVDGVLAVTTFTECQESVMCSWLMELWL